MFNPQKRPDNGHVTAFMKVIPKQTNKAYYTSTEHRKRIIEAIARFYILLVKSDTTIKSSEINTVYSLLETLFADENISWQEQISHLLETDDVMDDVVNYLNKNLITLDKIRLLISLIVLANADSDFTVTEVTKILDIAKKMSLSSDGLLEIMETIETDSDDTPSISGFRYIGHINRAIFRDYLSFGTDSSCQLRFQDKKVNAQELMLLVVDKYLFIGTGNNCTSFINGKLLLPNRLYYFPENAVLMIGNIQMKYSHLMKIYRNRRVYDVIDFKKKDYDFKIINNANSFSIIVNRGSLFRNGREISLNREVPVLIDDLMQIKGYQPFTMMNVIEERESIGTETLYPKKLFINMQNRYLTITREETPFSVVNITVENSVFYIDSFKKGIEIFKNKEPITEKTSFQINKDILSINKIRFLISSYYDVVLIPFEIERIDVSDVKHYFRDGTLALDGITFEAKKGEIIAVMGKSGCGKSSLLKAISADIIPSYGRVFINNDNLYENLSFYSNYIGYVPQHDLLFPNLTVQENLYYRGRLILPDLSKEFLNQKISNILTQTNLYHRQNAQVGELNDSILSGGERKRLNIALELLLEPSLIVCDEPTTGLSSTDSEQIIELLNVFAEQGKIVILTIHQPNPNIFEKFSRVLIMDQGGREVFFGEKEAVFNYFNKEIEQLDYRKEDILKKRDQSMPDFFQDIIDYPEYNEKNEKIYEQVEQSLVPKRKYPPNYWRDKYKRKQLFELISFTQGIAQNVKTKNKMSRKRMKLRDHFLQLKTYLYRNILMKLRNRTNMFITFAEAPFLALIIAFILRVSSQGNEYSYHQNNNIIVFFFVSLIVFVFLGLSNSIEEIMGERKTIQREKGLNLKVSYFLISKIVTLSIFSLVQVILYYAISKLILQLPSFLLFNIIYFLAASFIGFSLGLLISSFLNDRKAIINVLPLILIPQIIFGGAIILYEDMNPSLTIRKSSTIPEIVQFIPSRWLFEGLITAQAKLNQYHANLDRVEKKRLTLIDNFRFNQLSESEYDDSLNRVYEEKGDVARKYPRLKHTNESIVQIVDVMDGRVLNREENIFMASSTIIGGKMYPTYYINLLVLIGYILTFNLVTLLRLKYFFKER
jgi:ABC-type multidrug transport system ATPase subunit